MLQNILLDEKNIKVFFGAYLIFLLCFIFLPSVFRISFGFKNFYCSVLKKVFKLVDNIVDRDHSLTRDHDDCLLYEDDKCIVSNNTSDANTFSEEDNISLSMPKNKFSLIDICKFSTSAANVMIDDQVTKRFKSEKLLSWNGLMRSKPMDVISSWKVFSLWTIGLFFRYFILLPNRLIMIFICLCFLFFFGIILTIIPTSKFRNSLCKSFMLVFCRISLAALGIFVNFHDRHNKPKHGVAIANHTTPLDAIVLCSEQFFTFVGQSQDGFFKLMQKALISVGHIFFERSVLIDRNTISKYLSEHANNTKKSPMLIFPEGTCINNTSVMMFRKGAFEITEIVHPISIKYSPVFGDAFWDSSNTGFMMYLLKIATSWLIICDVWFLPAIQKIETETVIQYTNRTRHLIAQKAGLIELDWDGQLKRSVVSHAYKSSEQKKYVDTLALPDKNMFNLKSFQIFNQHLKKKFSMENTKILASIDKSITFIDDSMIGTKNFRYPNGGTNILYNDRFEL